MRSFATTAQDDSFFLTVAVILATSGGRILRTKEAIEVLIVNDFEGLFLTRAEVK